MRPVNRIPQGFLEFFGLKSLGKNPDIMLDEVRPNVDLTEWYLRTNAEQIFDSWQAGNTYPVKGDPFEPFATTFEVPAGEWWYIHACTMTVYAPAGIYLYNPRIVTVRNSQPSQYYEALVTSSEAYSNPAFPNMGAAVSRPRAWFPPKTLFGVGFNFMDASAIAADIVRINMHISVTRARA